MTANIGPGPGDSRVVEVPGGKGVYVGDSGTQVNVFGPQLEWPVLVGRAPLRADAFQERLELRRAVDEIRSGSRTSMATLVLAGGGGTGKTQLAAALFNSVRDGGADLAVWVSATSRAAVVDPYAQAYAATHPGAGGGDAERDALAFLAWLATTQRPWIVVLDDVADPGELSRLWPAGSDGRVVITTRRRDAALAARGPVVDVGVFSPQESLDYLHPYTMSTRHNLGGWQGEAHGAAAALRVLEPLTADRLRVLGPDHPDTLATRHNLAYWQGRAGDAAGAAAALRQLLHDQIPLLGPDHPDTLAVRHNLAYWQAKAADTGGATAAFRKLLQDQLRVFGPDHPDPLETRQELAELRGQSGDITGAITDLRQLLTDQQRVLRPGHPLTMTTRAQLTRWKELAALQVGH